MDVAKNCPKANAPEDCAGKLDIFVAHAPICIAMLDRDLKYRAYSRRWLTTYGRGRADLLGASHYDVHPDIPEEWKAVHRRALAGEIIQSDRDFWRQADGSEHRISWFVMPWYEERDRIGGILVSTEDITQHQKIEQAYSEISTNLAAIIDSASDAILTIDEDMHVVLFNPAAERMFGYRAQQMHGQSLDRLIPDDLQEAHRSHVNQFAQEGIATRAMIAPRQLRAVRSDGTEFTIEASISKATVGATTHFTAIVRNVTERERLLDVVKDSEQRMELALDGANLGTWDIEIASGKIIHNARLVGMLGYAVGEIAVDGNTFAAIVHPEDLERFTSAFNAHLQSETARLTVEYRMRHKDGHWVWIISRGRVVEREADGRALRMAGTNLDISERKLVEEDSKRLTRAFKLLSRCDSLLVHAHEERKLLAQVCQLAVDVGGYLIAWVGYVDHDAARSVRPVAQFGDKDGYVESANVSWGNDERGKGPVGTAIGTGLPVVVQDFGTSASTGPWREAARLRGIQSCISLPLNVNGQVLGAFTLYSNETSAFAKAEVELLKQLAEDLAYGIQALRSRIEVEESRAFLKREGEKNRILLHNASDGIHILDPGGKLIEVSDSFCSMLGYSREELLGQHVSLWDGQMAADEIAQALQRQFANKSRVLFETVHRRKDGSTFAVEVSGYPLELAGRPVLFNSSRDISKRKQAQDSLRESELRLRVIIERSPMGMAFSRDGITVDVNAVYLQMFGFASVHELRGQSLLEQIAPQCRADVANRIKRRAQGDSSEASYETVGLRKDGSQFPLLVSVKRLEFKDGPLTIAFLLDITQQKSSEEEIKRLAFYDQLTDLPNRRLLRDRLRHALANSGRSGHHGALLFVDLDDFKSLNDSLGHDIGDLLLKQVASRLTSSLRDGDSVARLGGDEFVVLLEGLSAKAIEAAREAETVSHKIFAALHAPYRLDTHQHHCTASMGATLFQEPNGTPDEIVKQADIAMFQAKKSGRGNLRFFDPKMQEAINAQTALEAELRRALEQQQFELYFQTQVGADGRPFGAEALIRWMHPERGLVSPAQFISLAERTDLIQPIGRWVLDAACAQLKAWESDPRACAFKLCVNVSAKQFHQRNFVESVREAVRQHGNLPQRLTLELTESVLLENIEDTIATMGRLREFGVQFSLDDFGTGYSSLQYLKRLPLHELKIDQSFVRDLADDTSNVAIVQTIIAMARILKLDVIAEGVETKEQHQLLLGMGCDKFQGYLFGRPVPIAQFNAAQHT
jgi:diguanylate cyclase (GGDEF)-like protein/PAS domain S-box-containing protein